jgi:hypothetical protein
MMYERRRDLRHRLELPAQFSVRGYGWTKDVSFRGLLLLTSTQMTVGQLCRIRLALPDEDPIFLHAVPIRVGTDAYTNSSAVGVRVLGADQRWEGFISVLQAASSRRVRVAAPVDSSESVEVAERRG